MGKTALIDADVLRYECSAVAEKKDEIMSFDFVRAVFDERIRQIVEGAECDDYILFLTGDRHSSRILNKQRVRAGEPEEEFIPNFRESIAVGKTYKGTRKQNRPFHWLNLTALLLSGDFNVRVANGCEADDLISIEHRKRPDDTVICTRDKDLRMVPGRHYGWECGKQAEFGPITYDDIGNIELVRSSSGNKIVGGGWAFFCAQLLTGDVVDNIGGARGLGPVKAFALLADCTDRQSYWNTVVSAYQKLYDSRWEECLSEQCSLLWIVRELNEDGSLKHFNVKEWLST